MESYGYIFCSYLFLFFLCVCHDFWRQGIPVYLLFLLLLLGIPTFMYRLLTHPDPFSREAIWELMASFVPGLGLLLLSIFSREALGMGDSYFFLLSGCFLPILPLCLTLLLGFFTAGLVSMCLLAYGKWKGKSMRSVRLPFLPCLLPAVPLMLSYFPKL